MYVPGSVCSIYYYLSQGCKPGVWWAIFFFKKKNLQKGQKGGRIFLLSKIFICCWQVLSGGRILRKELREAEDEGLDDEYDISKKHPVDIKRLIEFAEPWVAKSSKELKKIDHFISIWYTCNIFIIYEVCSF